ncbi:MAG: type II toxin-antitoxin system VapC family toxin [Zoogloeaceae bacterium]|jgi:predicted nucleic acid-binding protein|nr:type II toxin-antitoxin system VapC family toxin [Zoogloeaceae bacterium]
MYLLDTNIISELRKIPSGKANRGLARWADGVDADALYLSVITVQELETGVLRMERKDPTQAALFRRWLDVHVLPAFAGRILPVDLAIAQRSARLHVPDPRPIQDMLIAATALRHGLIVVTRNVRDFSSTGVQICNPFAEISF